MSMNKFMHPRNPYRKRPDFKQLAIEFPEFRKYAKQDLSGKINFNFKDQGAVWELTKCLLKKDFDLNVEILPGRLVPTLPLRLNYLLWIEDLLGIYKPKKVHGIDIGTGASCIYPLIAAKRFSWNMIGTDIDIDSVKCAISNIENNFLIDKVTVKAVTEDIVLDGALDDETIYDFCLCNPPFFSDSDDLIMHSRTPSRKPPSNAPSGIPAELLTPGGELVFIARIISDSEKLKDKIRIYTVMVGKKSNLKHLKQLLRESEDVSSVTTSVFCQGKTTRWGLAWTFVPGLDLNQVPHASTKKKSLSFAPFFHRLPISDVVNFDSVRTKLLATLTDLKIELDQEETAGALMITLKAMENTWINSRKKRRQERMLQEKESEKSGKTDEQMAVDIAATSQGESKSDKIEAMETDTTEIAQNTSNKICNEDNNQNSNDPTPGVGISETSSSSQKRPHEDESPVSVKKAKLEGAGKEKLEYLVASLILKENEESNEITIEVYFIEGTGGKDSANQLLTYLKNRLKFT